MSDDPYNAVRLSELEREVSDLKKRVEKLENVIWNRIERRG